MASKRRHIKKRGRKKSSSTVEVQYTGKYVFIKELNMNVKIHAGSTIKKWIKKYCKHNIHLKPLLYPAYNIT